ncbi:alpha/beta fold hydrolase [Tenacibaculum sp.]|nr:alpha/beta fold hydrolase [Tenacibaculum sp.]
MKLKRSNNFLISVNNLACIITKKIFDIIIPLIILILFASCSSVNPIPHFEKEKILKGGDFVIKKGVYKNKINTTYPKKIIADYMTVAVKENRNKKGSKIITLPVVRLRSFSKQPKEPIFILNGGPGQSNILINIWKKFPLFWLLNNHDIIMVGYRGVDSSVKLTSEAYGKARLTESNTLSQKHLNKLARVWKKELIRYKNEGIDIDGYNIIEVIDDMDLVKKILGYKKINLLSVSFGTRLAYLYGVRYPKSINRSIMGAVNPPGQMVFNPDIIDEILERYGVLWKQDSLNLKRSPDIIKTIQHVFNTLPQKWRKIHLDPEKIRIMMFQILYSVKGADKIFDGFIAAENGDYSGLALLIMMYDAKADKGEYTGDYIIKAVTADYQHGKNYITAMNSKNNLIGAPLSKQFAIVDLSEWKVPMIPEQYRKLSTSHTPTLIFDGNLDVSTPLENAQDLIKYLPNGELVVMTDYGHLDLVSLFSYAPAISIMKEFYLTGNVCTKELEHKPVTLEKPERSPQKIGKIFYTLKRLRLLGLFL